MTPRIIGSLCSLHIFINYSTHSAWKILTQFYSENGKVLLFFGKEIEENNKICFHIFESPLWCCVCAANSNIIKSEQTNGEMKETTVMKVIRFPKYFKLFLQTSKRVSTYT